MNSSIPFAFSASTELHEEFIEYIVPPAAQKIYKLLTRRAKPGTIQEFDKADFDKHCLSKGRQPFSIQWFTKSIQQLIDARVIQIVRKYRGYGYKLIAYHPWQLDEWLLQTQNSNKSFSNSNKSFSNSNKNFKKSTSDTDSSVPSYRCSREKQSNEDINQALEKTVAAASKKLDQEKCDLSQGKDESQDYLSQPERKGLKSDSNASTKNFNKTTVKEKIPEVDVTKINNKDWRSHLEELDQLGVQANKTIRDALKTFSKERVEKAIALFRQRKRETGYIANPNGYFMQILKENWAKKNANQLLDDSLNTENEAILFNYWYELAKELGYCTAHKEENGDRMVLLSGSWEKFIDAWKRGYNLEYLKKVKKRITDP